MWTFGQIQCESALSSDVKPPRRAAIEAGTLISTRHSGVLPGLDLDNAERDLIAIRQDIPAMLMIRSTGNTLMFVA